MAKACLVCGDIEGAAQHLAALFTPSSSSTSATQQQRSKGPSYTLMSARAAGPHNLFDVDSFKALDNDSFTKAVKEMKVQEGRRPGREWRQQKREKRRRSEAGSRNLMGDSKEQGGEGVENMETEVETEVVEENALEVRQRHKIDDCHGAARAAAAIAAAVFGITAREQQDVSQQDTRRPCSLCPEASLPKEYGFDESERDHIHGVRKSLLLYLQVE
jgi:hypothetical protein